MHSLWSHYYDLLIIISKCFSIFNIYLTTHIARITPVTICRPRHVASSDPKFHIYDRLAGWGLSTTYELTSRRRGFCLSSRIFTTLVSHGKDFDSFLIPFLSLMIFHVNYELFFNMSNHRTRSKDKKTYGRLNYNTSQVKSSQVKSSQAKPDQR